MNELGAGLTSRERWGVLTFLMGRNDGLKGYQQKGRSAAFVGAIVLWMSNLHDGGHLRYSPSECLRRLFPPFLRQNEVATAMRQHGLLEGPRGPDSVLTISLELRRFGELSALAALQALPEQRETLLAILHEGIVEQYQSESAPTSLRDQELLAELSHLYTTAESVLSGCSPDKARETAQLILWILDNDKR